MAAAVGGQQIVITRAELGELGDLLIAEGYEVIHLPLIAATDPPDGGQLARAAVAELGPGDWLVVTSPEGARRALAAGPIVPGVRTAAVGEATAQVLAAGIGRPVDLVPAVALGRELGRELLRELALRPFESNVVVLHGDLANQDWLEDLRAAGHRVRTAVAYCTVATAVDPRDARVAQQADAVVFASGSAVRAWVQMIGITTPGVVCSIGPSTTAVARSLGVGITHEAVESSVVGIVDILRSAFSGSPPTMG